uniref:Uncharacterized protein n=1 Tax=Arundo donax TaxID=35708 RepID=A0A0A9B4U8_ARUDO
MYVRTHSHTYIHEANSQP